MRTIPPLRAHCCSRIALVISVLLVGATGSAANAQTTGTQLTPELQAVRTSLEKYQDPIVAVRDGFFSTVGCIDFPSGATDGPIVYPPGAMGVHFLNPANIGPKLDPAKPQILIYEPQGDKLKLVAAEWFMPEQLAAGTAPTIFGQTLAGPMNGHEPIIPASLRHYDLHVWLWKDNPKGLFTSTNSAVVCPATAAYTIREGMHDMKH